MDAAQLDALCIVFIEDELLLETPFEAARAGLTKFALGDGLASASESAYSEGVSELIRVGPLGTAPGTSKLVRVRFQNLVTHDDHAGLAVRWEATGPGGGLFPALDADLTMMPAAGQTTMLRLVGSYRPPLGALGTVLDRAIMHRVAAATIREFLNRIAAAMDLPASARQR